MKKIASRGKKPEINLNSVVKGGSAIRFYGIILLWQYEFTRKFTEFTIY